MTQTCSCSTSFSPLTSRGKHSIISLYRQKKYQDFFSCVCVCGMCTPMCVLTCMCAGVHVLHVCAYMWRPKTNIGRLPQFLTIFFVEVGFLTWVESIALQYSFSGQLAQGIPGLQLRVLKSQVAQHTHLTLTWVLGSFTPVLTLVQAS